VPYRDFTITRDAAAHVLWATGNGGYEPGSFTVHLVRMSLTCDTVNLSKIAAMWPEVAGAAWAFRYEDGGLARLEHIVATGIDPDHPRRPPT
jgi:hypothetical protein